MTRPAPCAAVPGAKPSGADQPVISTADARLVLQHFGHTAPERPDQARTFRGRLVTLIAEADEANLISLASGYPGLVGAVQLARFSPTGITTLRAIANTR
ncbi:hypothetical protein ACFUEN_29210 [Streptomyces griseorubiginosus]|uniref:hypothetical protein n=1 Tax=Streptomyces griseorubiginosus TaxID=67304 RepID=UPI0036322F35